MADTGGQPPVQGARFALPAVILVLITLLVGGFVAGASTAGDAQRDAARVPTERSADVGFARAMQAHHGQAVRMSWMIRETTSDPTIRQSALDVLLTQQQQIGQMFAWLQDWDVAPGAVGDPMAWLSGDGDGDHDMSTTEDKSASSSSMPGMATEAQMRALGEASGRKAERIYLSLMIPHHEAGVDMAESALELASEPEVRRLAESIVAGQTAELATFRELLDERGGPLSTVTTDE